MLFTILQLIVISAIGDALYLELIDSMQVSLLSFPIILALYDNSVVYLQVSDGRNDDQTHRNGRILRVNETSCNKPRSHPFKTTKLCVN